jgi:hypothetical protein
VGGDRGMGDLFEDLRMLGLGGEEGGSGGGSSGDESSDEGYLGG